MIRLVQAREPLPGPDEPSVFLAGPTATAEGPVPSWRPEALDLLDRLWLQPEPLAVVTPENPVRARRYEDQFTWENASREHANAILFWIPRDMTYMPGMTTNVEFGYDVAAGRTVVLGCPPDCPDPRRNKYLVHLARAHGVPVRTTLRETVQTATELVVGAHGVSDEGAG
ncbi:hypothetical protein CU254_40925 (plasmid) [Amycolatopsis sp. AA4]|uniref:nucleoside 2-deoxyribosyltransferase domain-containing protein n=1 Tax=Actinomycetes TaxID=1760 RepID=UPI0001B56191|nr:MULTISPECIES: nucleoside 2-deoxyribosyltransferase domain-containing protein [Actinomycetes]ATY16960.1 hypothetical protein CU254_40925 [Amycolatopsis sp. AA4]EFL12554.1 conserved hypothetical protein [Streptomyces sp. AA4]